MNTARHHVGRTPRVTQRVAAIIVGLTLLAACGSTESSSAETSAVETSTTDVTITDVMTTDGAPAAVSYTIGAGDTLSGIAARAGVSVADIVAANGWSDGSAHLIIPGDVIKLPSGVSVAPVATTKPADAGSTGAASTPATSATAVCAGGVFGDEAELLDGETLTALAARLGLSEAELQRTNQFGTNGRPAFGSSNSVVVPCVANWPQNTTFYELIDPATCDEAEYYSLRGLYQVQAGQDAAAIAARVGVTLERLQSVNDLDLATIQPGDLVGVCERWF